MSVSLMLQDSSVYLIEFLFSFTNPFVFVVVMSATASGFHQVSASPTVNMAFVAVVIHPISSTDAISSWDEEMRLWIARRKTFLPSAWITH